MACVYLADSWVLGLEADESHVCFMLDAVLEEGHPLFYWPPKPGEQYPYAKLRWCLSGQVSWNDGPFLDHPATDAAGAIEYGNIDPWWHEGDVDLLEGDWGSVAIRGATQTVEFLVE
jgi:hypothetical protein